MKTAEITPTWQTEDGRIQLYCGDCLTILPEIGKVDAVITDPPYNVSIKGARIVRGKGTIFEGGDINLDFGEWDRDGIKWGNYIDLFVSLLTPVGVIIMFYDKLYLGTIGIYLQEKKGFQVRHIGAIVKTNPAPQARRVKWQNGLEQFLVATKNKGEGHHFNYKLGQSPDYFKTNNSYDHLHPTQKPLNAIEWITRFWSFENDTICDPFMGSGTTGIACIRTGRKFVGIEIDPTYFNVAKERIKVELQQLTLSL